MTHAPSTTSFPPHGDGSIIGCFTEKDHGKFFEFSENYSPTLCDRYKILHCDEDFYLDYPHKVWVTTPWHMDEGWRFAKVLKTVAYVLTNDEDGYDVVKKWHIKGRREYDRKLGCAVEYEKRLQESQVTSTVKHYL